MNNTIENEKQTKQKACLLSIIIGLIFGASLITYAISSYIVHQSFPINNTKGSTFTIDLNDSVTAIEALPGTEQSITASITNTGTEKCMFCEV